MTERVCFTLQVRPECLEEYRNRHRELWPDMLEALSGSGRINYSVFLRDDGTVIGYYETESVTSSAQYLSSHPVVARWNEFMSPLFADANPTILQSVFYSR